jgi:hypothetical protein
MYLSGYKYRLVRKKKSSYSQRRIKHQQNVEKHCVTTCLYCDVAVTSLDPEVIETHCSSQCYVGENICKCKYKNMD